jgi:hypothetical protein
MKNYYEKEEEKNKREDSIWLNHQDRTQINSISNLCNFYKTLLTIELQIIRTISIKRKIIKTKIKKHSKQTQVCLTIDATKQSRYIFTNG